MTFPAPKDVVLSISLVAGILLLPGCSGPQEDVRITFCKNLTAELLPPGSRLHWYGSEQQTKGNEYAEITVHLETKQQTGETRTLKASCRYRRTAVDDNAMTLSDPLSAYASVPYQMSLDGKSIPGVKLSEAILVAQLATGQDAVEQVKQGVEAGAERVRTAVGGGEQR